MTTVAVTRVEVLQTDQPSKPPKKPPVPNDFEVTNASICTLHLDMEIPPKTQTTGQSASTHVRILVWIRIQSHVWLCTLNQPPIRIAGEPIKQVSSFRYLGSLVEENGKCDAEIKARIGMAKANFGKMRDLLTNMSLNIQL